MAVAEDAPEEFPVTTKLDAPLATAVAQAGAELAQRLGMEPGEVIDSVASAVLQRGMGGELISVNSSQINRIALWTGLPIQASC